MQVEIRAVLGCSESALDCLGCVLVTVSIVVNNPFQSFPWSLADPVHAIALQTKSTAGTSQFESSSWSHHHWLLRLCEHNLTSDHWKIRVKITSYKWITLQSHFSWTEHYSLIVVSFTHRLRIWTVSAAGLQAAWLVLEWNREDLNQTCSSLPLCGNSWLSDCCSLNRQTFSSIFACMHTAGHVTGIKARTRSAVRVFMQILLKMTYITFKVETNKRLK